MNTTSTSGRGTPLRVTTPSTSAYSKRPPHPASGTATSSQSQPAGLSPRARPARPSVGLIRVPSGWLVVLLDPLAAGLRPELGERGGRDRLRDEPHRPV